MTIKKPIAAIGMTTNQYGVTRNNWVARPTWLRRAGVDGIKFRCVMEHKSMKLMQLSTSSFTKPKHDKMGLMVMKLFLDQRGRSRSSLRPC